jgi:hypothetical protein
LVSLSTFLIEVYQEVAHGKSGALNNCFSKTNSSFSSIQFAKKSTFSQSLIICYDKFVGTGKLGKASGSEFWLERLKRCWK